MAIRKRTIRQMSPVARKLAKLANESQSTMRKLKWLIGEVQELEWAVEANRLNEEDVFNVQPKDLRGSHPEDLSSGERRQGRNDQVGQSGNRRGAATRRRTKRPRNKRKKFEKGAKAL